MTAEIEGLGPTVPAGEPLRAGADAPLAAGTRAGDYVIERPIGVGGMGEVYAGHHPVIGKKVAIKVLRRELAARPEAAERFMREARAVNQIDHANVVDVFALGRLDDGRLYLVMDLLDGEALRAVVARGAVAPPRALAILGQVAAALDAAHAKGVVHRDLKPDNVVLTGPADRPTAHVLDFGIAKLVADAQGAEVATLTGQGSWLGTPAYMAPEQWTADGASAASDRYALGVLAFELLTGKPPFHAPSLPAMMEQHFRGAVPSVTTAAGAALPAGLDRVFARALAKDPTARPPTAQALVDELAAALAGKRVAGAAPRGWWIGAAGAAVVFAGGAVVLLGRGGGPSPAARRVEPARAELTIVTNPAGAVVVRGGQRVGETPLALAVTPGETIALELSRPGYVAVARQITVDDQRRELRVDLAVADGFAGLWRLPGGELRGFERQGEQVAGFRMRSPTERREFLRFFAFAPSSPGTVMFTASEPFVAEEAPDEPSCNVPLRAEYVYRPTGDVLELRKERVKYTFADGRCTIDATAWSPPAPLVRVALVTSDGGWVESRAGAVLAPPPVIGKDPGPTTGGARPPRNQRKPPPPGKQDLTPDAVSPGAPPPQQTPPPQPPQQQTPTQQPPQQQAPSKPSAPAQAPAQGPSADLGSQQPVANEPAVGTQQSGDTRAQTSTPTAPRKK
ncbi:MAG: serine/threonine protein kinase [Kofleriaceae bacterium]|nr:serine/threonine protein kinase [Kofleriaceae bacterium]